jgi:hypothetical protein
MFVILWFICLFHLVAVAVKRDRLLLRSIYYVRDGLLDGY